MVKYAIRFQTECSKKNMHNTASTSHGTPQSKEARAKAYEVEKELKYQPHRKLKVLILLSTVLL